jgi:hypothetical protein
VECKRVTDASWIFLVPKSQEHTIGAARLRWTQGNSSAG